MTGQIQPYLVRKKIELPGLDGWNKDVQQLQGSIYQLFVRNTLTNQIRAFQAPKIILAAGSIDSPKLLNRSSLVHSLPGSVRFLIGRGLTDHPTTDWVGASVSHIDEVPITRNSHECLTKAVTKNI